MTYLLTARFTKMLPGPYDVGASQDGVGCTFEVCCLQSELTVSAFCYWEEEEWAFRNAMGVATALNLVFHEGLVVPEGSDELNKLLTECPGPYRIRRGNDEERDDSWQAYSAKTGEAIIETRCGLLDLTELAIVHTIRNTLAYCDMYYPRYCSSSWVLLIGEQRDLNLF